MQIRDAWSISSRPAGGAAATVPYEAAQRSKGDSLDVGAIQREVTAIFDAQRKPVLRHLLAMGLPVADGEDVLQDTFLALFDHLRRGRPRTNLRGWVFRTAHNLGLKRRTAIHAARKSGGACRDADLAVDARPDPEQGLSERQRYARMCAALRALPERDRFCLSLRAEGLRYREIAQALGISLGSVANSIRRSSERLQRSSR